MSVLFEDGRDRSWMDYAACANHPQPDLWYPDNTNVFDRGTREAATICSTCPVRTQCFEFGRKERYGIYGGVLMSNMQRIQPLPKIAEEPARGPRRPPPRKRVRPKPVVAVSMKESAPEPVQRQHPAAAAPPVVEELVVTITDAPEPEQPEDPGQENVAAPVPQDHSNPITVAVNTFKRWLRL